MQNILNNRNVTEKETNITTSVTPMLRATNPEVKIQSPRL